MSRSFEGSQADAFVAAPRVVKPKRKYKEPEEEEDEELRVAYNNMMWEKRVVRGNTYAAMVTSKNVELPQKNTFKPRPQRQDDSALEALSHLGRRVNIEIFTDQFVERLTDKPPCYEVNTQTDFDMTKPIVRLYMKEKTGTDQDTQIWDDDLFDFDYEVEPLLQILCGKTLETSRTEVLQQQELRIMRERQKYYASENDKEARKIHSMEEHEGQLKEQNDRKLALLRQRKETQRECHRKLLARTLGKKLLRDIEPNTVQILQTQGFFRNPLEDKLAEQLLPSFTRSVSQELVKQTETVKQLQDLLKHIYMDAMHQHRLSLETEKTRRALIIADRDEKAREKGERKRMKAQQLRMVKFLEDERAWLEKMENQAQEEGEEKDQEKEEPKEGEQEKVEED